MTIDYSSWYHWPGFSHSDLITSLNILTITSRRYSRYHAERAQFMCHAFHQFPIFYLSPAAEVFFIVLWSIIDNEKNTTDQVRLSS